LASLCSPSARPPRAKKGLSARLCSYAKFHRSWRAWLRGAQSSQFGGCFELLVRLQVESKQNLKTGRLSWAIAPNTREWPDLAWLRLATAWELGRASHGHPSKHTLSVWLMSCMPCPFWGACQCMPCPFGHTSMFGCRGHAWCGRIKVLALKPGRGV
jgi:hypothetical protein